MAELLLSCRDLAQAFGAASLFEDLSFGVFEGDHVGLVGPNGSGKSTLLRILAGQESPSAGSCAARKGLRVGYVPQDPRFDEGETVASVLHRAARESHVDGREIEGEYGGDHWSRNELSGEIHLLHSSGYQWHLSRREVMNFDAKGDFAPFVPRENLIGQAFMVFWPLKRGHLID